MTHDSPKDREGLALDPKGLEAALDEEWRWDDLYFYAYDVASPRQTRARDLWADSDTSVGGAMFCALCAGVHRHASRHPKCMAVQDRPQIMVSAMIPCMTPWWTLIIALPVGVCSLIWGWSLGHRAGYDEAEWLFARKER